MKKLSLFCMLLLTTYSSAFAGIKVVEQQKATSFWSTCKDVVDSGNSPQPYRDQLSIVICFGKESSRVKILVSRATGAPVVYPVELRAKGKLKPNKCYRFKFKFDPLGKLIRIFDVVEINCETGKEVNSVFVVNLNNCIGDCPMALGGPISTEKKLDLFFTDVRIPDDLLQFQTPIDQGSLGDPAILVPSDKLKLLLQKQDWKQIQNLMIQHHENLLKEGVIKAGTPEADLNYFLIVNKENFSNPADIKKVFTVDVVNKLKLHK
jgi:hypothetical protein